MLSGLPGVGGGKGGDGEHPGSQREDGDTGAEEEP